MNFNKPQKMQKDLDQSILDNKPKMTAEERFTKTLKALSVEIGEIANCDERFKFWKDSKGKVDGKKFNMKLVPFNGDDYRYKGTYVEVYNHKDGKVTDTELTKEQAHKLTLVEECSDALHFVLSLANQLDMNVEEYAYSDRDFDSDENRFYMTMQERIAVSSSYAVIFNASKSILVKELSIIITNYLNYIYALGVSHEELEQAYYSKHKVNYKRQEEGY